MDILSGNLTLLRKIDVLYIILNSQNIINLTGNIYIYMYIFMYIIYTSYIYIYISYIFIYIYIHMVTCNVLVATVCKSMTVPPGQGSIGLDAPQRRFFLDRLLW